jgi:hypothetical protein
MDNSSPKISLEEVLKSFQHIKLKNENEAIALVIHFTMLKLGYKLTHCGDTQVHGNSMYMKFKTFYLSYQATYQIRGTVLQNISRLFIRKTMLRSISSVLL